ncbi:MAG: serine/threonine protein kinase, partial [Myxococcales bacterium]|nr:serine/threonine protein kinase [Myxococcales bacterium]
MPVVDEALRGRVIDGKYRLTRPLGEGGMGMVWVATHTALGREFAVKLLRPEFARDPQALIRFQQEAVAVGKVGSPHLVSLTDFGTTADGEPYIVMELLEGRTLEEAMRAEKPMAVPRIADIGCQILTALATVHERGIVHRDLKPANVFLMRLGDREDFVKLLDFGVAKVLGGDRISHFTRTGVLLGTPTYMSPEQVQGGRDVDHRCDLWAVGVILFRALTGRRPHEAASRGERLAAIATQDVPPLRRFRPDLGEDLEAVLGRALTREIGRRYVTALEFRAALEPFRGGAPSAYATSLAPPPPSPVRLRLAAAFAAPAPEARPTAPAVDRGATTIPAAVGRPTVPAVGSAAPAASPSAPPPGERPTVGPAQGAATRHDGAAAGAA